jgi:hypothetical protein
METADSLANTEIGRDLVSHTRYAWNFPISINSKRKHTACLGVLIVLRLSNAVVRRNVVWDDAEACARSACRKPFFAFNASATMRYAHFSNRLRGLPKAFSPHIG